MCKLLIISILGAVLSGCASSKLSRSSQVVPASQKVHTSILSKQSTKGCRVLKNGYLVCPKIARR